MKKRNVRLILLVLLLMLSAVMTQAQTEVPFQTDTPEPIATAALETAPVVESPVDAVTAVAFDGATAWIVVVALAGIAAIAYIAKVNSTLLADSVPREFATLILSGGDALVDVASNLADKFEDYTKKTDTQLDDQALELVKNFLASLQKRE